MTQKETKLNPIRVDRGGRHIGEIVAAAVRAVRRQEAEDARFHPVCASLRLTSSKDRDSEGAAVAKHPPFGGGRAQDHESGSVTRRKAQAPSLDSSYHAESSGGDEYPSSSISSARERRVGNGFRAPNFARDRDRDRTAAHSDARCTPANSCGLAASTDVVRSVVRSKLLVSRLWRRTADPCTIWCTWS